MCMEYVFLVLLIAILLGSLLGLIARKNLIRRIKIRTLQKPQYSIEDDLSPAEFGFIIDGVLGHKEMVAEVIQLSLKGHIKLSKNSSGKLVVERIHGTQDHLSPLQAAILKEIGVSGGIPYILPDVIEYETLKSLSEKGWIIIPTSSPRFMTELSPGYIIMMTLVGLAGLLIVYVSASLLGLRGENLYLTVSLSFVFELILGIILGLTVIVKGEMQHTTGAIRGATTKFKRNWRHVNGVYNYMRISGMDIFTPDYETLDFNGLDKLYPYAVAAGLDGEVLDLFY